jgi:hypothetical protein
MGWKYYNIPDAGSSSDFEQKFWVPLVGNDLYRLDDGTLLLPVYNNSSGGSPVMFSPTGDVILGAHLDDDITTYTFYTKVLRSEDGGKTWESAGENYYNHNKYLYSQNSFPADNGGMSAICNAGKFHSGMITLADSNNHGGEPCGGNWVLNYLQFNPETETWINDSVILRAQSDFQGWYAASSDGRRWAAYSGTWSGSYESASISTSQVGATATIRVKNCTSFRITAYKGPIYGTFTVSANGGAPTTVNLYNASPTVETLVYNKTINGADTTFVITCISGTINLATLRLYDQGLAYGYENDEIYVATMKAFTRADGHSRILLFSQLYLSHGYAPVTGYPTDKWDSDIAVLFHEIDVSPGGVLTLIEEKELIYIDHSADPVSPLYSGICFYKEEESETPSYEDPDIYVVVEEDMLPSYNDYPGSTPFGVHHKVFKRINGNWSYKDIGFQEQEESVYLTVYNTFNVIYKDGWILLVSMIMDMEEYNNSHCLTIAYNVDEDQIYDIEDAWTDPTDGSDIWTPCLTITNSNKVHLFYSDYTEQTADYYSVMAHKTLLLDSLSELSTNDWTTEDDIIIEWEHIEDPSEWWVDPYTCTDLVQGKIRLIAAGPNIPEVDPSGWGSVFYLESGVGIAEIGPNTQGASKTNNKYGKG